MLGDGVTAAVTGVVTARFPVGGVQDTIYVQNAKRNTAIAVTTPMQVEVGDIVDAQGAMASINGEKVLSATGVVVTESGGSAPKALGLRNLWLGGGAFGGQLGVLNDSSKLSYATGLSNVGLLVQVWGKVGFVDPYGAYFYVDDGAGLSDGSGRTGVRVACSGLPVPTNGAYVRVRGISGVTQIASRCVRLLRPRSTADMYSRWKLITNRGERILQGDGGEGGIRTHGDLRHNGFRDRPINHSSTSPHRGKSQNRKTGLRPTPESTNGGR